MSSGLLKALGFDNAPGNLIVWLKPRQGPSQTRAFTSTADAEEYAAKSAEKYDVYFGLCPQGDLGPGARGTEDNAQALLAVWVDIDVDEGKHKRGHHPTKEQAGDAIRALPVKPSAIVWSGGGYHVYWFLDKPWVLDTPEEREKAKALSTSWQAFVRARFSPFDLDATADLARVLRVPGTLNHKTDPPTEVKQGALHEDRRYTIAELQATCGKGKDFTAGIQNYDRDVASERNNFLISYAGTLKNRLTKEAVKEAVLVKNEERCKPPLPLHEIRSTIFRTIDRWDDVVIADEEGKAFDATDKGNARALVHYFGENLRYVAEQKKWVVFDGRKWETNDIAAERAAKRIGDKWAALALEAESSDDKKALLSKAAAASSARAIKAMVELARSEPAVYARAEEFDANPWLLNCANGTLNLKSGQIFPHDRAQMHTKMVPVSVNPQAACPVWDRFLARVVPQENIRAFLQRAVGYSLTGDTSEQVLFFLHGSGANGKSTFLSTLMKMMNGYAKGIPQDVLIRKNNENSNTNDIARLKGARLVTSSEIDEGKQIAEAKVKAMLSGESLTARFLHQEFFDFRPEFKIWFSANHKPQVRSGGEGFWRRVMLVPFTVFIPKEERDGELEFKLEAEFPGILNWALAGCAAWQESGLNAPEEVIAATQEYREDEDILAPFLDSKCVFDPRFEIARRELYQAYYRFAEASFERPMSPKIFAARLMERGVGTRKSDGERFWRGIDLTHDARSASKTDFS